LKRTGVKIEYRTIASLLEGIQQIDEKAAEIEPNKWMEESTRFSSNLRNEIFNSCKLYLYLNRLIERNGYDGVSVDCISKDFPLNPIIPHPCLGFSRFRDRGITAVCEADVCALLTAMLMEGIAQKPSYMGNVAYVDLEQSTVTLTHCVVALKMQGYDTDQMPYSLVDYHGTGKGVVPFVDFPIARQVTVGSISKDLKTYMIWPGEIIETGKDFCANMATVKKNIEKLSDNAVIDKIISFEKPENISLSEKGIFSRPPKTKWINKTLLHMGYPALKYARENVKRMVFEISSLIQKEATPKFLFKSEEIESFTNHWFRTKRLYVESFKWGRLLSMMEYPKQVCSFGLTLGGRIESIIESLGQESVMSGFVWDALCSTLAEYYADKAEAFIANHYRDGNLVITRRFSPGYCDLHFLRTQQAIFDFCNPALIGIRLNQSGLMIPRKSITGLVIAAERVPFSSPCGFCKRKCKHRRVSEIE
jgi:hypothetical protein